MKPEIVETEDGSISIRDRETGELHHNRAGAYAEALMNYIRPSGVLATTVGTSSLNVLDVCFGLGYNSFVLLNEFAQMNIVPYSHIVITGIELDPDVLEAIPLVLESPRFAALHRAISQSLPPGSTATDGWKASFVLGSSCKVEINIECGDTRKIVPTIKSPFDLVFHDPFSAKHVPELWSIELFQCYQNLLDARNGKILTYSSAAAVRGGLRDAGFHVYRTYALGGKSGGTMGSTTPIPVDGAMVFELSQEEIARVDSTSGIPYRDPALNLHRDQIRTNRLAEQFAREKQS